MVTRRALPELGWNGSRFERKLCFLCHKQFSEILPHMHLVLTDCEHIFCSQCIKNLGENCSMCPVCEKSPLVITHIINKK